MRKKRIRALPLLNSLNEVLPVPFPYSNSAASKMHDISLKRTVLQLLNRAIGEKLSDSWLLFLSHAGILLLEQLFFS